MKNNDININLKQPSSEPKVSAITKAAEAVVNEIANASWKRIVKVFLVVFFFLAMILGGFFFYGVLSDKEAIHQAAMKIANDERKEGMRDFVITPKIQKNLDATGLPFRYMDISYEVINQETKATKIGMQYQNIPTTLYNFPYYMEKNRIYIGTVDNFKKIDLDLGEQMEKNLAKYFAIISLNSDGTPIGYLGLTWCDKEGIPSNDLIKTKLKAYERVFSQLLDLRIQMKD